MKTLECDGCGYLIPEEGHFPFGAYEARDAPGENALGRVWICPHCRYITLVVFAGGEPPSRIVKTKTLISIHYEQDSPWQFWKQAAQ